jgi:prevent-host-death family protein
LGRNFDAENGTMLDLPQDIHSLSDFKRKTSEYLTRMKESGQPVVLTINGKAEFVVQDAASYRRLLELAERAEMMQFLRESREDIEAGRTEPAVEALERLGKANTLAVSGVWGNTGQKEIFRGGKQP